MECSEIEGDAQLFVSGDRLIKVDVIIYQPYDKIYRMRHICPGLSWPCLALELVACHVMRSHHHDDEATGIRGSRENPQQAGGARRS